MMKQFDFKMFESISSDAEDNLIGGFSIALNTSFLIDTEDGGASNNCSGGNCKSGCGDGQNIQCNTVAGCSS